MELRKANFKTIKWKRKIEWHWQKQRDANNIFMQLQHTLLYIPVNPTIQKSEVLLPSLSFHLRSPQVLSQNIQTHSSNPSSMWIQSEHEFRGCEK